MLAKDILVEIQAAQLEVMQLESDLGKIRKISPDKDTNESIEKDTRTSVRMLFEAVKQARQKLEDLENTDWERPVKTYICNTKGCKGIAPNRNGLCNKCVQDSKEQGF